MSDETIPRCRRCGALDAEAPEGLLVFASRTFFGPLVERDLCHRCFTRGLWEKWRFLVVLISAMLAIHAIWIGKWIVLAVAALNAGVWWAITGAVLRRLPPIEPPEAPRAAEPDPQGEHRTGHDAPPK